MRTCLVISVVIHAAVMLWLVFGPGAETFNPASAEPIVVDLVPPQEAPRASEQPPPKSEETKSEETKSGETKSELPQPPARKPEPPKPEPGKPGPQAAQKPAQQGDPQSALQSAEEERAATAARIARMLDLPTGTTTSLGGLPSEEKSKLTSDEIAAFKAKVGKCWVAPSGMPNTPELMVVIRIALHPDGRLGATEMIAAPMNVDGIPLAESAKRALRKCQPYAMLPADKYRDWKVLDLTFTAQGPSGQLGPIGGLSAAQ